MSPSLMVSLKVTGPLMVSDAIKNWSESARRRLSFQRYATIHIRRKETTEFEFGSTIAKALEMLHGIPKRNSWPRSGGHFITTNGRTRFQYFTRSVGRRRARFIVRLGEQNEERPRPLASGGLVRKVGRCNQ
jgi:hypothetical protein